MVSPLQSFIQGAQAGQQRRANEFSLQQAKLAAPAQNELLDLQLRQAQAGAQQGQQEQAIGQEMQRLQFMHKAALALRQLPMEQRPQAFQRLSPLAQRLGIDTSQFGADQLTDEFLNQSISLTQRFIQNPQAMSAELQSLTEKSRILDSAVDPKTGEFLPDEQLSPQQRIVLRSEGLRGRAPSVDAEEIGRRKEAELQARIKLQPQLEESISEAKVLGASRGEEIANFPKDLIGLRNNIENADNVIDSVNQALGQIGFFSTGFAGAVLAGLPESDSFKLRATIDTIKANLGFDRLQAMRDASKTGGALGNVTELELKRLEAAVKNLDPSQGDELLAKNLAIVLKRYERFRTSQINDVMKKAKRLGVNIDEAGGLPARAEELLSLLPQGSTDNGDGTFTLPDGTIVEPE